MSWFIVCEGGLLSNIVYYRFLNMFRHTQLCMHKESETKDDLKRTCMLQCGLGVPHQEDSGQKII